MIDLEDRQALARDIQLVTVDAVTLNPEREYVVTSHSTGNTIQLLAA